MNIDIVNIVTFFSVIITFAYLIHTIYEVRKENINQKKNASKRKCEMSDYDKILLSTKGLENDREKNTGTHFEDETVYLNRAKAIREESSFFSWINEC